MKRILMMAACLAVCAVCSQSKSPTAPKSKTTLKTLKTPSEDISCSSGYILAFDENGNPYCAAQ